MQSGILRRAFDCGVLDGDRIRDRGSKAGKKAGEEVDRPVTGVCVDPLNTLLVACTLDGSVHVRLTCISISVFSLYAYCFAQINTELSPISFHSSVL